MVVAPLLVRKMLVGPLATHVHLPNPTPGFNETSGDIVDGRTLVIVIVYCYSLSLELYIYYIYGCAFHHHPHHRREGYYTDP